MRDSNSSNNSFAGFVTTGGATMRLSRSIATGNSQGISSIGTIYSYGDNDVGGNTAADINATVTVITRQ